MNNITDINSLTTKLAGIGNVIVYLLIALAVVYIVWNVVQYVVKPSADSKTEALKNMGWGILGLFIIVSLWGLVNILTNTFSTNNNAPTDRFPNANFLSGSK
ncbi:MAG: pilin [Candidatus Paceibacterota bacterium]